MLFQKSVAKKCFFFSKTNKKDLIPVAHCCQMFHHQHFLQCITHNISALKLIITDNQLC